MSRRWLSIVLLLSVGVNVGIVTMLLVERSRPVASSVDRGNEPGAATGTEGTAGPDAVSPDAVPPDDVSPDDVSPDRVASDRPLPGDAGSEGAPPRMDGRPPRRPGPPPPRPEDGPQGFPRDADLGLNERPGGADRPPDGFPRTTAAAQALDRGELPPAIAKRLESMAERLGLTGADRDKFLEIQRRFFVASHQRRERIVTLQDRFRRSLGDPNPSREAIDALVRQLGEERSGFDRDLAHTVLDTRALLGPGQERQYLDFLARLGPRPAGPGGPGGPGGDRPPGPPGRSGPHRRRPQ